MAVSILIGDMRERLKALPDASVDSCVCDPPYHLTAGKKGGTGEASQVGRENPYGMRLGGTGFMGMKWDGGDVAFQPETWAEVLRVLKPGAHLIAFSGTRTYHRMVCAIEDAGFEIRDQLAWTFGSGFPKSHNLPGGLGTALKPAWEPICLARKPLVGTVANNVLTHGTGALNIDGCRINPGEQIAGGGGKRSASSASRFNRNGDIDGGAFDAGRVAKIEPHDQGRWPANLCHDGSDEVLAGFPDLGATAGSYTRGSRAEGEWLHAKEAGTHQAGFGDSGSAARFFYTAKATTAERGEGNKHPTVKPVALMRWLCRLVTPKGGTVLDPFMGSGSTGLACDAEQFDFIGCELSPEYAAIAEQRIRGAAGMFADVKVAA